MALGQISSGQMRPRVRMADGGSLLETALNSVSAPDPSGQSRIVNPFPGNYLTYGEGPEWNWFDYLNSGGTQGGPGTTPPPGGGTTPPPITGGEGSGAGAGGQREGNGFGGKGPMGNGAAQAAADAAARNTAVNPSLGKAVGLGLMASGPMGVFSALGKEALSALGITGKYAGPFDVNSPTLSPAQQAAIASSTNQMTNPSLTQAMTTINNAIMAQRGLARTGDGAVQAGMGHESGTFSGYSGSGGRNVANAGAAAGSQVGAGVGADAAGNRGGNGGSYGGGGDRGAGTQGGPGGSPGGGLGGGYRLARGGRLRFAGGGSSGGNYTALTSILPILAGVIGNATAGPVGGAIASGAATAMTGGSLQDAIVNSGPDTIDTFFRYFGPLLGLDGSGQPQDANTSVGQGAGTAAAGAAFLKALTQPAPTITSGQKVLPYTPSTRYAAGGELDARDGTHVQGDGDGQSDDIPAQLSDGEFVVDAATVSALGDGSNKEGAARLDQMRKLIRQKAGYKNVHTIPPKQKSVSAILGAVTRGKKAA